MLLALLLKTWRRGRWRDHLRPAIPPPFAAAPPSQAGRPDRRPPFSRAWYRAGRQDCSRRSRAPARWSPPADIARAGGWTFLYNGAAGTAAATPPLEYSAGCQNRRQ